MRHSPEESRNEACAHLDHFGVIQQHKYHDPELLPYILERQNIIRAALLADGDGRDASLTTPATGGNGNVGRHMMIATGGEEDDPGWLARLLAQLFASGGQALAIVFGFSLMGWVILFLVAFFLSAALAAVL